MNVVAIIPARGGSKGIPRKNVKELGGKPLIAHIIETALKVDELDRVIVSTDDEEIADVSRKYGAEVPFIRPEELARDETPTLPVLQHTVQQLGEDHAPDIVVLLYATSPLVKAERVSGAIAMLKYWGFDSVLSVVEDRKHYWIETNRRYERLYPKVLQNRQLTEPIFKENGAIYVCKRELLMEEGEITGGNVGLLVMEENESIDIDEPLDFEYAEFLMRRTEK